jgi:hypothetical protein
MSTDAAFWPNGARLAVTISMQFEAGGQPIIGSFDFAGFSPDDYERQLQDEFDQLYEEGAARRRMMSISLHDRISGHASRTRVFDRFLSRVQRRPDVWWARRDQIADWALSTPDITPHVNREPAEVSGLPGRSESPSTQ